VDVAARVDVDGIDGVDRVDGDGVGVLNEEGLGAENMEGGWIGVAVNGSRVDGATTGVETAGETIVVCVAEIDVGADVNPKSDVPKLGSSNVDSLDVKSVLC
jgi:hypothetical protein